MWQTRQPSGSMLDSLAMSRRLFFSAEKRGFTVTENFDKVKPKDPNKQNKPKTNGKRLYVVMICDCPWGAMISIMNPLMNNSHFSLLNPSI